VYDIWGAVHLLTIPSFTPVVNSLYFIHIFAAVCSSVSIQNNESSQWFAQYTSTLQISEYAVTNTPATIALCRPQTDTA
jgi:Na+/proline symporter